LEVGTGSQDRYQVLSVPYYNGLYIASYLSSEVIMDGWSNWTQARQNFEVTESSEPVGANIYVTTPYFNKSMSFPCYVQLESTSQGFDATSLIVVICVLVGVFLAAGIAIFLLVKYAGTIHKKPRSLIDDVSVKSVDENSPGING
jgi:hypothetical protein